LKQLCSHWTDFLEISHLSISRYNDVSNQLDATNSVYLSFKSAVHVSGDKLAHLQEHFLTVYTAFGKMHRYCCRPVAHLPPVGGNIGALLHLFGCLHCCSNDARSHKHQYLLKICRENSSFTKSEQEQLILYMKTDMHF
jgi:hypothetical protein